MNVNFEAIEKAWFKPKKEILREKIILEKLEKYLEQEATNIIRTDGMYRVAYQEDLNILNKIQELKKGE